MLLRTVAHRLLSSTPPFSATVYAIWAGANQEKARTQLDLFAANMTNSWFAAATFSAAFLWWVLWWVTSIEPTTRRHRLQAKLRIIRTDLSAWRRRVAVAPTDDAFTSEIETFDQLGPHFEWVAENMGTVACDRLNHPPEVSNGHWSWPANPSATLARDRSMTLCMADARIKVVDQFLQSDAWDGPPITRWKLFRKKWNNRKKSSQKA
jgi:hypothetical protein